MLTKLDIVQNSGIESLQHTAVNAASHASLVFLH